jgi:hypothetical protein
MSTKAVTVDADFNVIQIQEPKGLPPNLIVPKIAGRKGAKEEREKGSSISGRSVRVTILKPEPPKRKLPQRIVEVEQPKFDNEITEATFADKIVCAPGVTFRDGIVVKSRPPQNNANQLTRTQYEEYLKEMKRMADAD